MSSPKTPGPKDASAVNTNTCLSGLGVGQLPLYVGKSVEDFCPFGYGKVGDPQNHCAHFVSHALNIQIGTVCSALLPWDVKHSSTDPLFRAGVKQDRMIAGLYTVHNGERTLFKGASTRVNEIYNSIAAGAKGDWDSRPDKDQDCLICVTVPDNIDARRETMGQRSRKHIGIHTGGQIYHYGNTDDKVKCDSIEVFQGKFRKNYGKDAVFLWATIPSVGTACVPRGNI